ncbi:MAG: LysM peptidoglycan-binding domain-containing protein [Faecalibacterium sp.]|nr:LysM peptidoglycan-binding domain-containing protein [Ruminococcus sp.]MCM1392111.1 LysM peptidoglycan-binding domain-containing protein [Ruminococcus sp.]MCM1485808.1 LysM peptidoglycan-binding domain-containing protein [Faecalibacterium sp.]
MANNPLQWSLPIFFEVKSMDIYLKFDDLEIKLPVLPESYEVTTKQNNETVDIVSFGELLLKGTQGLSAISFSSFFPFCSVHGGYSARAKFKQPFALVNSIKSRKEKKKVVRLIITETNINDEFLIDEFAYGQSDGSGDVNYTLSLTQYRRPKVNITSNGVTSLASSRAKKETVNTTYTVKSGDTLKSIAKKQLGSSAKYTKIASLNHIAAPYTIKTGQVILIK